jgi:hypothetical protein
MVRHLTQNNTLTKTGTSFVTFERKSQPEKEDTAPELQLFKALCQKSVVDKGRKHIWTRI